MRNTKRSIKRLIFIRHGATFRITDVYRDEKNIGLNFFGILQVKKLIPYIRKSEATSVIVSPFRRCIETYNILSDSFDSSCKITIDPRLRERDLVSLYGMKLSGIQRQYGRDILQLLKNRSECLELEENETFENACLRVIDAFKERFVYSQDNRIVFISHGGPHSWILCHLYNLGIESVRSFKLGTGKISVFEKFDDHTVEVRGINKKASFLT